jgi:SAM-dependent methyltransferase
MTRRAAFLAYVLAGLLSFSSAHAAGTADKAYEPISGQAGKDVVWVPTPPALIEKMLDLAQVGPQDFVMDLGSGDGRNVIAAAKRGARALGVEYNPEMVELAQREARKSGVGERALFVQGDMYEADISQATVLALFLLPENLDRLLPRMLAMRPGSRIVLNTFGIPGWNADRIERTGEECGAWCDALLYIVPAQVAGEWQLDEGTLKLDQSMQKVWGELDTGTARVPLSDVRLLGDRLDFTVHGVRYSALIDGAAMQGKRHDGKPGDFRARRIGG